MSLLQELDTGTPIRVGAAEVTLTIDGQTAQDNTVTIRDRDSTQQRRIAVGAVGEELRKLLRPGG